MSREPSHHHNSPRPISLDLQVETPENVVLTYQLAGPAARGLAFLLDSLIRIAIVIILSVLLGLFGVFLPGLSMGLLLLALFVLEWGYFVIGETFFHGQSIGKWALGLRVIQVEGHPVSFWPSLLRNLLRAVDADVLLLFVVLGPLSGLFNIIPLYATGLLAMLLSPRFQRVGDLLAGTVVVTERRVVLPREPLILDKIDPLPREELGSFVPQAETLAVIDQFLGRRSVVSHARGHALASVLAGPLARRLHYRGDPRLVEQYPMAFLARVYVTFIRTHDEEDDASAAPLPSSATEPLAVGAVR